MSTFPPDSPRPVSPSRRRATRAFFHRRGRLYGDTFKTGDYFNLRGFQTTQRAVARWLPGAGGLRILDVGCGTGLMTAPWSRTNTMVGVDFVLTVLRVARRRLAAVCADAGILPVRDDCFDAVLSVGIVQHLDRAEGLAALAEAARVVAPGGTIVVVTLNGGSLVRRLLRPRFERGGRLHTMYSPRDLAAGLREAGICQLRWRWLIHPLGLSWTTPSFSVVSAWCALSVLVAGHKE